MAENTFGGANIKSGTQASKMIADILTYKNNPSGIQRVSVGVVRDIFAGKVDIVDPTNPFVTLMECSAINTAAAMIDSAANTRKQYANLAQTDDDLYMHMSDRDYVDRFAIAANTTFTLAFKEAEVLAAMVLDPVAGIRKLVIPRNTEFTVADTTFSMQYPIEIRQLSHGGIEIVYDTDKESPLQTLSSNVVEWEPRKLVTTQERFLMLSIDVQQFAIASFTDNVSPTSGLTKTYAFPDKFCYARVYQSSPATGNQWVEVKTTHSSQQYDNTDPTVVLRVLSNGRLAVSVPQVYITNGLIRGKLRIDIHSTKGPINMVMANYVPSAFSYLWRAIDNADNTVYTAPLRTLLSTSVYCTNVVASGKDELGFDKLRSRVIRNAVGPRDIPITNVQAQTSLEDSGYDLVMNTDVVTNRDFLATKPMPTPSMEQLITAAASSIGTVILSTADAVVHPLVRDNGSRITFVPDMLYKSVNGVISVVSAQEVIDIKASDAETQAGLVTGANYLYTPFHYVLDSEGDEFKVRPYYLDKPESLYVTFESQNDTTQLQVNSRTHSVQKTDTGYRVVITTQGNQAYRDLNDSEVFAQMSFIPAGESARSYLNGLQTAKTVSGNRIFTFDIATNIDVDGNDNLVFDNFLMIDDTSRNLKTPLLNRFDILYSTTKAMGSSWVPDVVDTILGKFTLPNGVVGITNDQLEIRFGYPLKTLWARSRSVSTGQEYKRYDVNVPLLYEEVVYQKDPQTGYDFTIDPATGVPEFTVLHEAGDPVLVNNVPQFKHRVGEVILQPDGSPIPIAASDINREIDIMFIEGVYYFATDKASSTYRQEIVDTVVTWLTGDLEAISKQLIEQSELWFYPKSNMGNIKVMIEDGQEANIDASQSFTLRLFVTEQVNESESLKESLRTTAVRTIDNALNNTLVAVNDITSSLDTALGSDVLAFELSKLAGDRQLTAFTILNSGDRASLRKKLQALPNNTLIVAEDVTIDFVSHARRIQD